MATEVREEAARLLALCGGEPGIGKCLEVVSRQFATIQGRTQLLLTLSTITLTITGFSGPRMAESGVFARYSLSLGLCFVLAAVVILLSTLRIRWLTQFSGADAMATLIEILSYRNRKTRWFLIELGLLMIGMCLYVVAVISYLLVGFTTPVPH